MILSFAIMAFLFVGLALSGCGSSKKSHKYSDVWSSDAEKHWHACEDKNCTKKTDVAEHTPSDWIVDVEATYGAKGHSHIECTVCGYVLDNKDFDELPAKDVTITYDGSPLSKTYDGTALEFNISDVTVSNGATPTLEWYKVEGETKTKIDNAPIDAGTYSLLIKTSADAEWKEGTLSIDALISKKVGNVNVTKDLNKVYDGQAVVLSNSDIEGNSDDPNYTITWYASSTVDPNYILTEAPKNAGVYTAMVEMTETTNYSGASTTVKFEISKRTLNYAPVFQYGDPTFNITMRHQISNSYSAIDGNSKSTNIVDGDYVLILIKFNDANVGSELINFEIDEAYSSSDNRTDYLNYVLDTEVKPAIVPKKLSNLELTTVYDGTAGRTEFVLTESDGIVNGENVKVNITGSKKWNGLSELKLTLSDGTGDEVISFVEAGDYTNYQLVEKNGCVGKITIAPKALTNLKLQTYNNNTAGRTNFALSTADGIIEGDKVLVNITGTNSQDWWEGEVFDLVLSNADSYPKETISLVENDYSSNYILVETDELVGTIEILPSVTISNVTFKASEGSSFTKGTLTIWEFKITDKMGLEAGDSATIVITVHTGSGKIELSDNNTSFTNKKYIIGSGCYIDLDN